jgi:hypothetical protein
MLHRAFNLNAMGLYTAPLSPLGYLRYNRLTIYGVQEHFYHRAALHKLLLEAGFSSPIILPTAGLFTFMR